MNKLILILTFLLIQVPSLADDPRLGELLAAPCAVCHGERGAKPIANYPVLAGQHEDYLVQSLLDYKSGKRSNAVMASQANQLSELDIRNLAAYFSAQETILR